ncbi:MAG TPA: cell division protein FtsZ [Candidatus Paceibacterota bacterium]|nr:cell division protein FtsZ [Verrucomicrobiota bacterium]HSA11499.1 cell division protein FtsZ [Candidatus Paceibacterota bacterium]
MITNAQNNLAGEPARKTASVKVFGLGGAGIAVMELLLKDAPSRVAFVAVDTDAQSLETSAAADKIHLETQLLRGLGSGGDPERAQALAQEQLPKLKSLCEGADVVLVLAGLGGGAGTGIGPVLAQAGKEAGALVLGFVTMPFQCEGSRRQRLAEHGLAGLKSAADGAICLPNQQMFKMIDENTSVRETFQITNEFLAAGVRGIWRLLLYRGLIEIHFSDLAALIQDRHTESAFAVAEAAGPTRSREVMDKLLAHPMFDGGHMLAESEAVLVSLLGGPDLTMAEVNRVMELVNRHCEHAQVIMGAAIDDAFSERLAVTLIAARASAEPIVPDNSGRAGGHEELGQQLLPPSRGRRSSSRFGPPPPALSPDQIQQLLTRQNRAGAPQHRTSPKMRQGQLPLEIVSKGRFDKSEPTIHKGEDLDVPTYIRRGVPLN